VFIIIRHLSIGLVKPVCRRIDHRLLTKCSMIILRSRHWIILMILLILAIWIILISWMMLVNRIIALIFSWTVITSWTATTMIIATTIAMIFEIAMNRNRNRSIKTIRIQDRKFSNCLNRIYISFITTLYWNCWKSRDKVKTVPKWGSRKTRANW